jgi:hypothetical protein
MNDPFALAMALSNGTRLVRSALPDAPVVPDREPSPGAVRIRRAAATALHRLADRVDAARPYRPIPALLEGEVPWIRT